MLFYLYLSFMVFWKQRKSLLCILAFMDNLNHEVSVNVHFRFSGRLFFIQFYWVNALLILNWVVSVIVLIHSWKYCCCVISCTDQKFWISQCIFNTLVALLSYWIFDLVIDAKGSVLVLFWFPETYFSINICFLLVTRFHCIFP